MISYNKKLTPLARVLRKNMTPEAKHLWYDFLKRLPYPVKRQHNIEDYIVDFYIAKKRVVIEVDGVQHQMPEHEVADAERDRALSALGITVLRYTNEGIRKDFHGVAEDILNRLELTFNDLKSPRE